MPDALRGKSAREAVDELPDLDLDYVTDEPPTIHRYPRDSRYRRSGSLDPQPGDVALCGFVKQVPNRRKYGPDELTCVRCAQLKRLGE